MTKNESSKRNRYSLTEHSNEIITHIIKSAIWLPIAGFLSSLSQIVVGILGFSKLTLI